MMKHILLVLYFFCVSIPAYAKDRPDLDGFGQWPVLHEGRIKTVESFSRNIFYQISGTTELHGVSAIQWLVDTMFDPSSSISKPFIKIDKKSVLEFKDQSQKYHSMAEVMSALQPYQDIIMELEQRDSSSLTASQKDLLSTYNAVVLYNQIIQSFSAILPLRDAENKMYSDGGGSKQQRALIAAGGRENDLFKFIPTENPSMPLVSLWQAINSGVTSPFIEELKTMTVAWNEEDYATWNNTVRDIGATLQSHQTHSYKLDLEHIYVVSQPILWIMVLYILGVIGTLLFAHSRLAFLPIFTGFFLHLVTLVTRSVILMRPPTGTLYETLLFGTAIMMTVGVLAYLKNKNQTVFMALCAGLSAFLLFISEGFVQGDSLNVLVAVLNTNFWLSTHVTCVIIGYAFCMMTAIVAHVVLATGHKTTEKLMMPLALFSLLFMSIGTLLGGIWADQSWGRFWGWDPKENGALLIVLWLVWVLHGRLSGHLSGQLFPTALSLTTIMVAITWFGVNLLGVGLHSYGFISGIAWGLGLFCAAEIVTVIVLYHYGKKEKNRG